MDTFSTIIGAVVGAAVASIIGYFTAMKIIKRQEFFKASNSFRSAFVREIRLLNNIDRTYDIGTRITTHDILTNAIDKHERACIIFSGYLPKNVLVRFNAAWEEYICKNHNDYKIYGPFLEYAWIGPIDGEIAKRDLAINRIKELLDFAKFK